MQRIFFIFLLLFVFFRPCAHAAGPVPEMAYFHDETASTDIEDIHLKGFKPFDKSLRLGFARGDTWIRVSSNPLDAGENTPGLDAQKVLRVGPHYLDQVWMHQWDGQRWVIEKTGDLTRKNAAVCQDDLFCFFHRNQRTKHSRFTSRSIPMDCAGSNWKSSIKKICKTR